MFLDLHHAFRWGDCLPNVEAATIIVKSVGKAATFYLFFPSFPGPWPNVEQNINVCAQNCSVICQH